MSEFDVVVIGAGPGGEVAADRLHTGGLRVALVERELIGGECAYWACIPSKTLLRPPETREEAHRAPGLEQPALAFADAAPYRDVMIRGLDDSRQVRGYEQQGVTVVKGVGRIAGAGRVDVDSRVLETERIVVRPAATRRSPRSTACAMPASGPTGRPPPSPRCQRAWSCSVAARRASSSRRCFAATAPRSRSCSPATACCPARTPASAS